MTDLTAWQILKQIADPVRQQDLERQIHHAGGWRTFFDMSSHQWSLTTMDQKLGLLGQVMDATGVGFAGIALGYAADYGQDRRDIVARAHTAYLALLDHALRKQRVLSDALAAHHWDSDCRCVLNDVMADIPERA